MKIFSRQASTKERPCSSCFLERIFTGREHVDHAPKERKGESKRDASMTTNRPPTREKGLNRGP